MVLALALIVILPVLCEEEAKMEVDSVLLSFPQYVESGRVFAITARYEGPYYKVVLLIPPPGVQVNNSLTPISFHYHIAGAVDCRDPEFKWTVKLNATAEQPYTFKLLVISSPYNISFITAERMLSGKVEFGSAKLSEVSFTITAYNVTGIKLQYQQQISALQQQLASLQQQNAQLQQQLNEYHMKVENLTKKVNDLNRSLLNATAFAINMYWENKGVGVMSMFAIMGILTFLLPYWQWKVRKKRFDERMKGRKL